ncbi:MAG: adenine deaminase [Spirochaetaceae bacterium]|nr:adenine deaminase [Spirochaetaceae bacterium]MCF7947312.1 adenine deaminase [Spirochaetia bacterium]MCF7952305.1 adenine deaminase [Spirochaetaceae bacterium]
MQTAAKNNINKADVKRRIEVATGRKRAELVFKGARVVNVFSHEVIEGNLAVDNGVIIGVGAYEGVEEVEAHGRYLIPGLIDAHVHIESSLTSPGQFAKAIVPHGTTAIVADPHEIANVCGVEGIRYMLDASRELPLEVFFMLPSCVPATEFENAGAVLDADKLAGLFEKERVLGLGEVMDYPALLSGDDGILDKIMLAISRGKMIDGHGPMLLGKELNAYAAAGVASDHESSTLDEMRERLRVGMYCLIRQGSAAQNLPDLITGVNAHNSRRCMFCTDDRQPEDILAEGHIDNHLRLAVERGIDPITAVQMATINSAEAYRLEGRGALAPGYRADIVMVDDLTRFNVQQVYVGGKRVAASLKAEFEVPHADISKVSATVNVKEFPVEQFKLHLETDIARVIRLQSHSLITEEATRKIQRDAEGCFEYHNKLDVLKMAVVERHKATGHIGIALVENYKLSRGAVASTIAHDSHNIIVIGENDRDMYAAVQELIRVGGGITMALDGEILATLELPIAGLMSDETPEYVSRKLSKMYPLAIEKLGVNNELDPFMTLSFLALPVIPELKLTDMGLFDTRSFSFTEVSVK